MALPNVCHPKRVRVFRRRRSGAFFFTLLLLITLWPLPLTQGNVPEEIPELVKPSQANLPVPEFPTETLPQPPAKHVKVHVKRHQERPKIAIVVDDLGDNWEKIQILLHIDAPLTLAFLPNTPFSGHALDHAPELGKEIFLHVPMEPENPDEINAPQFLLLGMKEKDIYKILDRELSLIPHCHGINNHMGSRLTKDREAMAMVLKYMREHHLSFLDSRTSNESIAYSLAQEMGVPTAMRDVFLDHNPHQKAIERQFQLLRQVARQKGSAVAIGHPHANTLSALQRQIKLLRSEGFDIVPVSKLM